MNTGFVRPAIAIVLTACGIETFPADEIASQFRYIAIVLTACGIETLPKNTFFNATLSANCNSTYRLRY